MKLKLTLLAICLPLLTLAQVQANLPNPQIKCDINNPGDGMEVFDLTESIPEIIGSQTNVVVTFHPTSGDALGNGGVIANPDNYTNEVNPQTVFVRVENINNPADFAITSMEIEVRLAPEPLNPNPGPLVVFDDDGDGFAFFDLTAIVPELTNDPFVVDITYYTSEADAQNAVNPIGNPETYMNISNPQLIYVRMQNAPEPECVTVVSFEILADPNLSVQDQDLASFVMAPNPATDTIMLRSGKPINDVTVFDLQGRMVLSQTIAKDPVTMDVGGLAPGMYLVVLDQRTAVRLIKQ